MPTEQIIMIQKRLREQNQTLCKNSLLSIDNVKENKENPFIIKNAGCTNDRRNGSAYCEQCSIAWHHGK